MADRSEKIIETGTVVEALPNATFRVLLKNNSEIFSYISGKMRLHRIKVLVGDKVKLEMNQYGKTNGRIIQRL